MSSGLIIGIVLIILIFFPVSADLTVRFLDVGEGDAVLLQSENKTILIDSGTKDSGNLTNVYLNSLNITKLDTVLITSPDEGRTGAMINILNNTSADNFIDGGWNSTELSYLALRERLQEDNTPVITVSPGSSIPFSDGVVIDLLTPANRTWDTVSDTLIPMITYGDVKFLLMGDDPLVSGNVSAQVLRVADHGSGKGSDAGFIHKVSPKIAIVSTGPNTEGNPATDTLNLLESNGASVLRTDIDGVITITTDGKDYTVGKLRMEPEMTISLVSVVETRAPVRSDQGITKVA